MSSTAVYTKVYVEHGDGWRFVLIEDDGAIVLQYEEYNHKTCVFDKTREPLCIGPAEYVEKLGEELIKLATKIQEGN